MRTKRSRTLFITSEVCLYAYMDDFYHSDSVGTRAREGHSWALNGNGYFSFWQTWDTVGTLAPKMHNRCTIGAQEVHERCTRGAREVHSWGLNGNDYF